MQSTPASANLSRLVAIVPLAALEGAKTRLGGSLDAEERQVLVLDLLDRTVRAAGDVAAIESVVVVSPDPAVLRAASAAGATPVRQAGQGLNDGLDLARRWAVADGASALVILPGDLAAISPATLAALIGTTATHVEAGSPLVALVADRHGRGTNVLLVSPPDAIPFAFGPDSRTAHLAAAQAAGATIVELDSALSLDLDLPEDLVLAESLGLFGPARRVG